ncbi:MAG TPA: DUF2865 domain-containing protein [Xanthobacteraceae bacterium]|nr:DUF2865 domain-containing protein [Xanthobacteraceae bacterium]
MLKLLRGLGWASCGALALTVSAAGQGYPQGYPNYPAQQPYPSQSYPSYPAQPAPPQSYPAPAQGYPAPARGYPPQSYPAQASPGPGASAQPVGSSPVCVRLEAQLATLNSGAANSTLASQIQSAEDAIAKQQADIDRAQAQARKAGCGQGFFSLFSGFSPQCGPLNSKIDEMRGNLDRMMSDLEQLKSGNDSQQGQRTALIGQLAQNNCGSQYTQAVRDAGPQGFFEALLGGGGTIVTPGGNGAPVGTYRTVCVRTCDGFYFPISYSTVPGRFAADAEACQRLCPAAPVALYTYHNPGEEIEQAVSVDGAPYTALPNAFRYRKELVTGCSCRKPGETWEQTLHSADDTTLESGDIVVTDKNEKALTQVPQGAATKPQTPAAAPSTDTTPDSGAGTVVTDPKGRKVRVVGPQYLSTPSPQSH